MLPSEQELARALGVSQGTARKALDSLTSEGVLVRRQGRGTFVAEFEESRILFQFFRLAPDVGERLFPNSRVLKRSSVAASPAERAALRLEQGAHVWRIERVRNFKDEPILTETLSLSVARFPKLEAFAGEFPTTSTGSTQPSTAFRSPAAPSASRRLGQTRTTPENSAAPRERRSSSSCAQRLTTPTNRPSSASPTA